MPILIYFEDYEPANVQAQQLRGRGTNVHIRRSSLFSPEDREAADAVVIMPDVAGEIAKKIVNKYTSMKKPAACYRPKKGEILQSDPETGEISAESVKVTVKTIASGQGGVPVAGEQPQDPEPPQEPNAPLDLATLPPAETATPEQMRDTLKKMDLAVPPRIGDENLRNMYRESIEKARKGE